MAMDDGDWSITRSTGAIRYIGPDHTVAAATYATVIQFHRWIQAFADNEDYLAAGGDTDNDEHDIIDRNATDRSTDNIITLQDYAATGGVTFNIDAISAEHLYDGTIVQGTGPTQERWDGFVNFGNATAHIQVLQDGAVITDDFWNYGRVAGTETGGGGPSKEPRRRLRHALPGGRSGR